MMDGWWSGLRPEIDVEQITVRQIRGLLERGSFISVLGRAGMEIDQLPTLANLEVLVEIVALMAATQGIGRGIDDVLDMPFLELERIAAAATEE